MSGIIGLVVVVVVFAKIGPARFLPPIKLLSLE